MIDSRENAFGLVFGGSRERNSLNLLMHQFVTKYEDSIKEDLVKLEKRVEVFKKFIRNYTDTDEILRNASDLQTLITKLRYKVKEITNLYR